MIWSASSLARNCAYVNVLKRAKPKAANVQVAAGRGTVFHAHVQRWIETGEVPVLVEDMEMQGWIDLLASQWAPPAGARAEVAWGLGEDGDHVEVVEPEPHVYQPRAGGSPLLTAGRADLVWMSGSDILCVVDWKTGKWPAPPADTNLQIHAAGLALARRHGAAGYHAAIYYVRDGVFEWGMPVERCSYQWTDMLEEVRASALLPPEPRPGSHCGSCWERKACASAAAPDEPTDADPF